MAAGAAAPFDLAVTMEQLGIRASLNVSVALGSFGIAAFVGVAMATKGTLVAIGGTSN